jgi:LmbE family N-acetylglucosaminyl deacetylase
MKAPNIVPKENLFERILAIGPHPDDVELGCFGALAKYKAEGSKIAHFVATCGGVGGEEQKRRDEAMESAKIIDAKVYFGELPDTAIPEAHPTIGMIEAVIKEFQPTCIIVNSPNDTHQDHRAVAKATISAGRFVPLILYYQTPSSGRQFTPNVFVDITETIDEKMKAVKLHKSQGENVYMADRAVRGLADFMALQVYQGGKYVEGFELYQMIVS